MSYKDILQYLIYFLEFLSILVIVYGVARQFWNFAKSEFKSENQRAQVNFIIILRNYLGTYILFSLEILIGADIIESIISPTLEHLLLLAILVIIRTVISYFLNKEIDPH